MISQEQDLKKASVKEIVLRRDAGTWEECQARAVAGSWDEAEAVLRKWAVTAPKEGEGSHECRIVLNFEDGEGFSTRVQLKLTHVGGVNLANLVLSELKFMSGEARGDMTEEDYQKYIRFCKIDTQRYRKLLDGWEIPA